MASTYSSTLGIELMTTGEDSGTWGSKTNNNLSPLVESAICGRATATFSTDADLTVSITNGTDSTGRYLILNCVSGVSLTATRQLICPLNAGKTYLVYNNTTGSQSITVIGATGTGITIPNGKKAYVYTDGTNYLQALDWLTDFTLAGTTTLTGALTYGGVTLSAAVTGTGSMVLGTSPQFTTSLGIGMTPVNVLDITQSQNAASKVSLYNASGGTAGEAQYQLKNGAGNVTQLAMTSTGYAAGGLFPSDATYLYTNGTNGISLVTGTSAPIRIGVNAAQVAAFTSAGDFIVGKTAISLTAVGGEVRHDGIIVSTVSNQIALYLNRQTSTGQIANFSQADTEVGSISVTSTTTAYNTSSDRRLKTNIMDADDAGVIIDALRVRQWDWKSTGSHEAFGLVAQEEYEVYAPAVTPGDGDYAVIAKQWQRDDSKLVPLLVKELQSLRARVAVLENA